MKGELRRRRLTQQKTIRSPSGVACEEQIVLLRQREQGRSSEPWGHKTSWTSWQGALSFCRAFPSQRALRDSPTPRPLSSSQRWLPAPLEIPLKARHTAACCRVFLQAAGVEAGRRRWQVLGRRESMPVHPRHRLQQQ